MKEAVRKEKMKRDQTRREEDWCAHEWLKGNLKQDNRSDSPVYDAWLCRDD